VTPFVDAARPENDGLLAHLARRNERQHPLAASPDAFDRPYLSLGSHPDVVERVWRELAPEASGRLVVLGTPAAVVPEIGTVLAIAYGTSYWLRLAPDDLEAALTSGAKQQHRYGLNGPSLDAAVSFGPTWILGTWDKREPGWVLAAGAADRLS
jgi:hypothetical protein